MINSELLQLIGFLNSELLWLYIIIVIASFYAIASLLTWSIKKPLMFLGIPTIIVGILLLTIRFLAKFFLPNENILTILNSITKPLLVNSIICIVIGIVMIVVYQILKKEKKKEKPEKELI